MSSGLRVLRYWHLSGLNYLILLGLVVYTWHLTLCDPNKHMLAELRLFSGLFVEIGVVSVAVFIESASVYLVAFRARPFYAPDFSLHDEVRALLTGAISPQWWQFVSRFVTTSSVDFVSMGIMVNLATCWLPSASQLSGVQCGKKYIRTIAHCHLLRVLCYHCTLLPSQKNECFTNRFAHGDPDNTAFDLWEMVFVTHQYGGCNDLIFSGHFVIIVATILLFFSILNVDTTADRKTRMPFVNKLTLFLITACGVVAATDMIYKGHHYSVDVLLAAIITPLYWNYISCETSMFYVDTSISQRTASPFWLRGLLKKYQQSTILTF
eukprot:CAMPEP_0202690062 /NCGR_PEP_ID=MMETSP1385-20130828/5190_1 /ASSEMBLY_ACC=CAM_ASM_000861 /TAXON_ID=933848 /ORGANISM="Elphidium margaritaceum" /LENGTH=322 /DNA_ID=CAMNT_0049345291 /DNA_START=33 /DNA_END=998 /DNA_ORIENTATION=+